MNKQYLLLPFFLLVFTIVRAQEGAFITTWDFSNVPYPSITIKVDDDYTYNYNIDFGDGTIEENVTGEITHDYELKDIYTISITGEFPRFNTLSSKIPYLISIDQWGDIQWQSMEEAFGYQNGYAGEIEIKATDIPDLSQVTSLRRMFQGSDITTNVPLNDWDVTNVTDMSGMFDNTKFDQPLDNWDVSNVTDMSEMFWSSDFNHSINNWDVSNVTNMARMFAGRYNHSSSFNQPLDQWDVSNVTDMTEMFWSSVFNQPINNWDVSNVTNMTRMFSGWYDYHVSSFNQPLDQWDVSSVTDMTEMFWSSEFNQPINNWDVSNVTKMDKMFAGFDKIISPFNQPLDNWDVSNVTSMTEMFSTSEFNQPINSWDVSNVTDMTEMFSNSKFNQPINSWNVSNVTEMFGMFYGSYFNQPIDSWDISNVTNMSGVFNSSDFNQPLNDWDVSNVTNMSGMFNSSDFNQPLNDWDVSNVTNMFRMFRDARNFNQPLDNWDLSNVTDARSMFQLAVHFNQDISQWEFNEAIELTNFLTYSGLDPDNYSNFLEGMVALGIENKTIGVENLMYCDTEYRNQLVYTLGWSLIGDARIMDCSADWEEGAFVSRWEIKSDDLTLKVPFQLSYESNDYDYTIDWGDGFSNSFTDFQDPMSAYHTYQTPGVYTVIVEGAGEIPKLSLNSYESEILKLRTIEQWGDIPWNTTFSFEGCENLEVYATDIPDLSQVKSIRGLFSQCKYLVFNESINDWDVSNVKNMNGAFRNTSFNKPLDNWDVSNVESMERMFYSNSWFKQDIGNWDVSNVEDMYLMFGLSSFDQPIGNWDVSNVVDMRRMFIGAAYNQPLDNWDVSNVTNMESMFSKDEVKGKSLFNQPIGSWDVSNVENMNNMFSGGDFNQNINDWDVSNVTSMVEMFKASVFNKPIGNWDVSSVTDMSSMFAETKYFNQSLDNWDVSSVTDMNSMFRKAEHFNQPLNNWDVSSVEDMKWMFSGDNLSTTDYKSEFNSPIGDWDVSNVVSMEYMFYYNPKFNQPIGDWDISNTFISRMFQGAESFNQPLDNWDVSEITSLNSVFRDASSFNQDLSTWEITATTSTLAYFLDGTAMDIRNYDRFLLRLIGLQLTDLKLGADGLHYCNEANHDYLINELGWTITGDSHYDKCRVINGTVLYDQEGDGCDEEDSGITGFMVNADNGIEEFKTFTNQGNYTLGLLGDSFDVSVINYPSYFDVDPGSAQVDFEEGETEVEQNFCVTSTQFIEDLKITILPFSEARPGFEADYQLVIENMGTETMNDVEVNLIFEDEQEFVEADLLPEMVTENNLTFDLGTIGALQKKKIDITFQIGFPPNVLDGDVLTMEVEVLPNINDYTPEDNVFVFEQVVVNSFDPNDKQVVQGEEVNIEEIDQYLDYIIRFQNTGSASAVNVRIKDTLDSNLDYNTLQPLSSSHDYRVEIKNDKEVEFIFENIYLPPEVEDEEGSNGYIAFKIKPLNNLEVGDVITGKASIYFDFNEPIVTNTVSTTIVEDLSVKKPDQIDKIVLYPNPTRGILNFKVDENIQIERVSLFDIEGKFLPVSFKNDHIDIQRFRSGLYFIRIQTNKGVTTKQIIKQ